MTPIRLSHIWYRRLYVALFVLAIGYVTLYALQAFNIQYIPDGLRVELIPAILSLFVAVSSVILWRFVEKITTIWAPIFTYGVLLVVTAWLVQTTGGVHSHFLAVWALMAFAAPILGAYGWIPAIIIIGTFTASAYLENSGLPTETVIIIATSSFIPLIAGLILWRNTPDADDTSTRNVKNLASQLSEVAAKSEIIINAIGDGVITVDGKGIIQLINPAAQEILGWGKKDALILNYRSVLKLTDLNGKEVDSLQDPIQQVLNNNQQARANNLLTVTNSGKKISVSIVASPIGEIGSGAIAVFRDVTDEHAEEREQAEFISTASHEMRTPVASIEGYLGLALNPATATIDTKARDFIMKAHEAAQHLGRLFQDLLDVSKSEDGRMGNTPRVLDLVPFTQTIVQGLTQKATDKGLRLTFVPGEGNGTERGIKKVMPMYYVNLDNDHIREVLDNLVENAVKYTPEGEVRVDISGTEDSVVISIKDTGLGIPPEDIPHLFQKFYRVDNADRQSIGGTGLGLYLCRRLIEAMQGRLWVESIFGQGSTFFVELPRISSQEAETLKAQQDREVAATAASQPAAAPPVFEASMAAPNVPQVPVSTPISIPVSVIETPVTPAPVAVTPTPVAPQQATPQTIAPAPQSVGVQPSITGFEQPQGSIPATPSAYPGIPSQGDPRQQAQLQVQAAPQPQIQQSQLPQPTQPATGQQFATPGVKPATTVPRGETLTRDQINERVRQLEALAQQQRSGSGGVPAR